MINATIRIWTAAFILLLCNIPFLTYAQNQLPRKDKIYFRSGFGFSIPVADSKDYLKPKFSSSLGGIVFLGKSQFFIYPKLGLNAYSYDQLSGNGSESRIIDGRSTTYLLSLDLGYRKSFKRFALYGAAGPGGGFILLPRMSAQQESTITLRNEVNRILLLEGGIGGDYSFGNVLIFAEGTYTHALNKLDGQTYQAIPLNLGIRTNISKVFQKN